MLKYNKRLLLRSIHHFKPGVINNINHMRISGTEPSSIVPEWSLLANCVKLQSLIGFQQNIRYVIRYQ